MPAQLWSFDAAHSAITFIARHMVVARVYGRFNTFTGRLEVDPNDVKSGNVEVRIDAASIDTNYPDRDNHLRSPDFLDVAHHPEIVFRSTTIEGAGGAAFRLHGDLTIRGITKPIVLEGRSLGALKDPQGHNKVLFNARGVVNRTDYGITWNRALDNGGWLVSEKIDFEVDVQAIVAS